MSGPVVNNHPVRRSPGYLALWCTIALLHHAVLASAEETIPASPDPLPVDIEADRMERDEVTDTLRASGGILIKQGDQVELRAEQGSFHLPSQTLHAAGDLRLRRGGDQFTGTSMHLQLPDAQGQIIQPVADLAGPGGHFSASRATLHDQEHMTLDDVWMTQCDCTPAPWHLTASEVKVDQEQNRIIVRNATLRLFDVPIAYTPWWRLPLQKVRQSGLLMPTFRQSRQNGMEADLPYYWNIAPNRDATLTLHPTTERGVMGKVQYRYIDTHYQGRLEAHGMHDTMEDQFRGLLYADHQQRFDAWRLHAHVERTFSNDFITDFEQKLVEESALSLDSFVRLQRLWNGVEGYTHVEGGTAWFQDLQAADDQKTPQQLPYMAVTARRPLAMPLWYGQGGARYDRFFQLSGDSTERIDLDPALHHRASLRAGTFDGTLGVRETLYRITGDPEMAPASGLDDTPHREAAWTALRFTSVLQRDFMLDGTGQHHSGGVLRRIRHTVEPSVQYVANVSGRQDHLPNYDSWNVLNPTQPRLREFNVTNLYATNFFPGIDRISEGQWISYGVTSRLLGQRREDGSLRELATVSLGQRWADANSRIYQNNHPLSDLVAGLDFMPSDVLTISSAMRYDPHQHAVRSTDLDLTAEFPDRDLFGIGYHQQSLPYDEPIDSVSARADIGIVPEWRWLQEVDYSLEGKQLKTWRTGLAYEHDCWGVHFFVGRSLSVDPQENQGNFIGFAVAFRGLGSYGFR